MTERSTKGDDTRPENDGESRALQGMAQQTVEGYKDLIKAVSGPNYERNWRIFVTAVMLACETELGDGS